MSEVTIYTKARCPFCHRAKALLDLRGIAYREIDVTDNPDELRQLLARSSLRTVPQIFVDDTLIGGYTELSALDASGELPVKLGQQAA